MRWFKKKGQSGQAGIESAAPSAAAMPAPGSPAETEPYVVAVRSPEGERAGASPTPLLVYSHMAQHTAQRIAHDTTINCIAIAGLEALSAVIGQIPSIGLLAMSRPAHVGEAELAIQRYRQEAPQRQMALYGAWDYHVGRAATRAIACQADGIMMPGIRTDEEYAYILGVMQEVFEGAPPPTSIEAHVARLKRYTSAASPFWQQQELAHSRYY
jgi:hypothetical protein